MVLWMVLGIIPGDTVTLAQVAPELLIPRVEPKTGLSLETIGLRRDCLRLQYDALESVLADKDNNEYLLKQLRVLKLRLDAGAVVPEFVFEGSKRMLTISCTQSTSDHGCQCFGLNDAGGTGIDAIFTRLKNLRINSVSAQEIRARKIFAAARDEDYVEFQIFRDGQLADHFSLNRGICTNGSAKAVKRAAAERERPLMLPRHLDRDGLPEQEKK